MPRRLLPLFVVLGAIVGLNVHAETYLKAAPLFNRAGDLSIDNPTEFRASLRRNVGLAFALGFKFTQFRVEAELVDLRNETEPNEFSGTLNAGTIRTTGSVHQTSGFANAYYDIPLGAGFAPYVGVGLGCVRIDPKNLGNTRNGVPALQFPGGGSVFGYQGMLGLQYTFLGKLTLNGGYRFINHGSVPVHDLIARRNLTVGNSQVFEVGLAYRF